MLGKQDDEEVERDDKQNQVENVDKWRKDDGNKLDKK